MLLQHTYLKFIVEEQKGNLFMGWFGKKNTNSEIEPYTEDKIRCANCKKMFDPLQVHYASDGKTFCKSCAVKIQKA